MATLTRSLLCLGVAACIAVAAGGPASARPFPEVVALPGGWQAEGVATGPGSTVFAGSLATGAVWRGDLRTGAGSVLVPPMQGRVAVGLKHARGLLYVAGGPTGMAHVHDARTGAEVRALQLSPTGPTFVNDVVVTRGAAWFTDSFRPVLYRLAIVGGVPATTVQTLPLVGEWVQGAGFAANGIAATADGGALLVMHSSLGTVFRVDPDTGQAVAVDSDTVLTNGDGILLRGRELVVVQNRLNQIAVLRLSPDLSSATLVETLTDPDFAVPTTVASFGSDLYAVNAKFGTPPTPSLPYEIVKVDGT